MLCRGIYVVVTYILVFLVYRSGNIWGRICDYVLMLASTVTLGYWMVNFEVINYRAGAETEVDQWIAMVGVLVGIEVARRVVGNVFVVMGTIMILYGIFGEYVPELVSHAGDTFPELCTSIFYKSDGVFGIMANVLATYIILFVFFGAFLEKSGAQRFFIDFPLAAVGHKIGGAGKVAVIASGLFGSISGSAIANTVSTGAFTIPMMKKAGFKSHVAGGIEPAASIFWNLPECWTSGVSWFMACASRPVSWNGSPRRRRPCASVLAATAFSASRHPGPRISWLRASMSVSEPTARPAMLTFLN